MQQCRSIRASEVQIVSAVDSTVLLCKQWIILSFLEQLWKGRSRESIEWSHFHLTCNGSRSNPRKLAARLHFVCLWLAKSPSFLWSVVQMYSWACPMNKHLFMVLVFRTVSTCYVCTITFSVSVITFSVQRVSKEKEKACVATQSPEKLISWFTCKNRDGFKGLVKF